MERIKTRLHLDWKFKFFDMGTLTDDVFKCDFDDSAWENITVPHDWAAKGEFKRENDIGFLEVWQDGIRSPIEHTGRTGGLPHVGCGIYRKWIEIPATAKGRRFSLEFDGIMWESNVYINGKHVNFCHFGYKSFEIDISDFINYGEKNLIAVEASVFENCSRWYPGAGIYRNAYLIETSKEHINFSGVWIRPLHIENKKASFELSVDYTGSDDISFRADIISPKGEKVLEVSHNVYWGELSNIFTIENAELWDTENPALYTAKIYLLDRDGNILDNVDTKFGARTFEFTLDRGFILNGRKLKLNGVCNHHDLGSIGAAVNVSALRRQLRIMREMGVNAIRTSHNPPSPDLLDICDELGFIVMDEFFDEWHTPKVTNGYAKYYREHAINDMVSIIKRDRNHPSVMIWSIGNEINEQWDPEGWRASRDLADACRVADPTRPTTAAFSDPWKSFEYHLTDYVDVIGINYKPHHYEQFRKDHPWAKLVGTETESCVSTRDVYNLPAEIDIPVKTRDDLTVSSYELAAPEWANYAEREFCVQDDLEYLAGEFVWTGFDYLGEPTPYYTQWPSRSSYFGVIDLCGLPKNRFYLYKAHWTDSDVLHIFPHWNWEGHEGETVPVHAFISTSEAELFINGKSYGRKKLGRVSEGVIGELERYRFMWNDAVYEPGEIKVVAYDENGNAVMEKSVFTAGSPHHIELSADRKEISADGEDLVYITASVVDEKGNVCPHSDARIFFNAEGGKIVATDNGDQRETESFARPDKKCLAGKVVACACSVLGQTGTLTVEASGDGILGARVSVEVK